MMTNSNNQNGRDLQEISREMGLEVDPMDWYEAQAYCESLGNGWRLPTLKELRAWYDAGYRESYYWSSNEINDDNAGYFRFDTGGAKSSDKYDENYVRAVRELPKEIPIFNYKLTSLAYIMAIGPCQSGFGHFFNDKERERFEEEEQLVTYADSHRVELSAENCRMVIFPSVVVENYVFGTITKDKVYVEVHTKWSTVTYKGYGLEVANLVVNHLKMLMSELEREIYQARYEHSREEYYNWLEKRTGYRPE